MKNFKKIIITILGATNTTFSIFIPIALVLLLLPFVEGWGSAALWIIGILSTVYRAVEIGFLKTNWEKPNDRREG